MCNLIVMVEYYSGSTVFTFYSLKIGPKKRPQLLHGSKTEIKKSSGQILCVAIAYLKENSKIKDKFFRKILTQK